jgi:recombination protein RecA
MKSKEPTRKNITKLDRAIAEIKEDYGQDVLDKAETLKSWGSKALDAVLGGLPNRIVELYGAPGSGKSTMSLIAIADAQKKGKTCAYFDVEHGYTKEYAQALGVDTKKLLVVRKCIMEEVLDMVLRLSVCEEVGLIVIDSLPALVPKIVETDFAEEHDLGKKHIADRARLMSEVLNLLTGYCVEYGNTIIIVNQVREKIGVMFGSPKTTPGGNAIKHYALQRIEVIGAKKIKKTIDKIEYVIGRDLIIKAEKNKITAPFIACEIPIIFGKGLQEQNAKYHKLDSEQLDKLFKEGTDDSE